MSEVLDNNYSGRVMCRCGNELSLPEHPCPFAIEINDDSETLCTCCVECMHACAMDV